jgi:hypothetical protein
LDHALDNPVGLSVLVVVVIVTTLAVPPAPVFLLLLGAPLTKLAMLSVTLPFPAAVIGIFVRTPAMIIGVVGIIDAGVSVLRTTGAQQR